MTVAITSQRIATARRQNLLPIDIEIIEKTGSTNADLLRRTGFLTRPTMLLALSQTAGRGRNGRAWHSAPGASLTFSLAWKFDLTPREMTGLPLAVGVAIARALGKFDVSVQLKWPNDVLKDGRKLAGVLIEVPHASQDKNEGAWAVVGIGMNLTLPDSLEEKIDQPAADLSRLVQIDRNALVAALLDELANALTFFNQSKLLPFLPAWNALHAFAGQEIMVIDGSQGGFSGLAAGIDSSGRLLVDTTAGQVAVISGDVSLRALNGCEYAAAD